MSTSPVKNFLLHIVVVIAAGLLLIYSLSITIGADLGVYQCYANVFLNGRDYFLSHPESKYYAMCLPALPTHSGLYNTLPAEYPFLSLVPMVLAMAGGNDLYPVTYIFLMLVVIVALYLFLFYHSSKRSAAAFLFYTTVGGFSIAVARLDIVLGALILLCLYQAERKKFVSSYLFLAVATMFKLVPIFLLIPLFLAEQSHAQRSGLKRFYGLCIFLATSFTIFFFSLVIDTTGTLSPLKYNINRPIQIESVPASIMVGFSHLKVISVCFASGYGSYNIYGDIAGKCNVINYPLYNSLYHIITTSGIIIFMLGLLYISRLFVLKKLTLAHAFLGMLLLFLCTNKVFSPQYLLWIYPLIAYIYRFNKVWVTITVVLAGLTTLIYPFLYGHTILFSQYVNIYRLINVIALRNIFLVLLTMFYIFNIASLREKKGE